MMCESTVRSDIPEYPNPKMGGSETVSMTADTKRKP